MLFRQGSISATAPRQKAKTQSNGAQTKTHSFRRKVTKARCRFGFQRIPPKAQESTGGPFPIDRCLVGPEGAACAPFRPTPPCCHLLSPVVWCVGWFYGLGVLVLGVLGCRPLGLKVFRVSGLGLKVVHS